MPLIALAALALLPAAAAAGAEAPIATLTAESPISAGHGWLIWSSPMHGGWALQAFHEGHTLTLPVAPRPKPFDASVGTDAHGAPVVTFSRCAQTPRMYDEGLYENGTGILAEPNTGRGCRVYVLELSSGRETEPAIPHPSGTSDTTPAMWLGTVAFARRAPGHARVSQLMLWSPRHPGSLTTLPHGGVPEGCPHREGCSEFPPGGEIQSLALDGQVAAFVWRPEGPGVGFDGAWEERVDSLASRHGQLAGTPILTESCTAPAEDDEVEEEWPSPPLLSGAAVQFPELERGGCYSRDESALLEYRAGRRWIGTSPLAVVELAADGATDYGLVAEKPSVEQDPGCSAALPCTLQVVEPPALKLSHYKPSHPFND